MWKFQILREIKVGKSVILTDLEALNCDINAYLHFLKAEITKSPEFRPLKSVKMAVLHLLDSPQVDFT